jgi:hypothetical protein
MNPLLRLFHPPRALAAVFAGAKQGHTPRGSNQEPHGFYVFHQIGMENLFVHVNL